MMEPGRKGGYSSLLPAEQKQAVHISHEKGQASVVSSIMTAVGNFSVQMNFQAISIALIVMSKAVCTASVDDCKEGKQDAWVSSSATATVFMGSIIGQLTMGYAGDVFGRTNAMGLTSCIALVSILLSATIPTGSATQVYSTIIACRFFLGIGLGGVYPLAATKASEDSAGGDGVDSTAAATSFFWQTPGSLAPWILAIVFTSTNLSTDARWRLLLGLGAVPSFVVLLCVLSERRTGSGASERRHSISESIDEIVRRESVVNEEIFEMASGRSLWLHMLGTGGCWFIYDIAYYGKFHCWVESIVFNNFTCVSGCRSGAVRRRDPFCYWQRR